MTASSIRRISGPTPPRSPRKCGSSTPIRAGRRCEAGEIDDREKSDCSVSDRLSLARRSARVDERPTPDPDLPPGSILLVEDNRHIRALEAQVLREGGCEVIEAGDAEEALACLSKGRIALLVTDIRLPGAL